MEFMGLQIDAAKLMTRQEVLDYLKEYGETDRILADIRARYDEAFENELIWHYPMTDGHHLGFFIVPVREGFLSLPYDSIDRDDYEIMVVDDSALLDADSLRHFIDDWKSYSEELISAMSDMIRVVQNQ
jgi:hypothetical protein